MTPTEQAARQIGKEIANKLNAGEDPTGQSARAAAEKLGHTLSCGVWPGSDAECTCGLEWRIKLAERDATIAELQQQVDGLRADAERLDWIEKRGCTYIDCVARCKGDGWEIDECGAIEDTLRAAIDSAIHCP